MEEKVPHPSQPPKNAPTSSSPVSRYMMMKSKRKQLNTLISDYSERNVGAPARQLDSLKKQLNENSFSRHFSNQTFQKEGNKMDSNLLLSEYSEFMIRSGMADNKPFRKAVSPENDRKNNTKDIGGATSFIRQYESDKPLDPNHNAFQTFKNYKKSFVKRREEAGNVNSRRHFRTDDIEGANSKVGQSVPESQRAKLTSGNLVDILSDIEKYRNSLYEKNGRLNLYPKFKPAAKNKGQTYNVYNHSGDQEEGKLNSNTPRKIRDMTIDNLGQVRTSRHYKSQPRRQDRGKKTFKQNNISPVGNLFSFQNDIEFNPLKSKRQERLKKLQNFFKNPTAKSRRIGNNLRNKSLSNIHVKKAMRTPRDVNDKENKIIVKADEGKKLRDIKKTLLNRPYLNHTSKFENRSKSVLDKYLPPKTDTLRHDDPDPSRNIEMASLKVAKMVPTASFNKDRSLISNSMQPKENQNKLASIYSSSKMNTGNTGNVSQNEVMLNKMYIINRKERDFLNRKTLLG